MDFLTQSQLIKWFFYSCDYSLKIGEKYRFVMVFTVYITMLDVNMKPLEGIEPSTYSLPRNRYTSKPQRHSIRPPEYQGGIFYLFP